MKVKVGVSNRHVHLCEEDYRLLFGDADITKKSDLNQPGEYASNSLVTIKGEKNIIENVRVLGPFRSYTQVEISRTDCYKLGVNPPVVSSGDLENASMITIIGPAGSIVRKACIIANRHIHVDKDIMREYSLENISVVKVKVDTIKGGIFENVYIKETKNAYFEMHIDTDDANAFLLKQNDEVEIIL